MKKFLKNLLIIFIVVLVAVYFLSTDLGSELVGDLFDAGVLPSSSSYEAPEVVDTISEGKYAYNQLSDEEKIVYDQMLDCMLSFDKKAGISTKDQDLADKVFDCIFADYGSIFYVSGCQFVTHSMGDNIVGMEFEPNYTMTKDEKEMYQAKIDEVVDEWLAGVSINDSDYTKSKYVFETLVNNVDYVADAPDNQNIISTFINRETVCQGYANAAQVMLEKLGVPCTIIGGTANGEAHAWNMVILDENYYLLDVTWGNSTYLNGGAGEKHINYAFLNATSEQMASTHTADMKIPLPECSAMKDNYFVVNGKYFNTFVADEVGGVLASSYKNGEKEVSIRFSNLSAFNNCVDYMINDQNITYYCRGLSYFNYVDDDDSYMVTFIWK